MLSDGSLLHHRGKTKSLVGVSVPGMHLYQREWPSDVSVAERGTKLAELMREVPKGSLPVERG